MLGVLCVPGLFGNALDEGLDQDLVAQILEARFSRLGWFGLKREVVLALVVIHAKLGLQLVLLLPFTPLSITLAVPLPHDLNAGLNRLHAL